MADGDIFYWKWADDDGEATGMFTRYHCKSCIAIEDSGDLYDTYWLIHCADPNKAPNLPHFSHDGRIRRDRVKLTWVANIHELTEIYRYNAKYYDLKDIVDLQHPNALSAPVFLRPGAKRSAEVMRAAIKRKLDEERSAIYSAKRSIERLQEELGRVEAGKLEEVRF